MISRLLARERLAVRYWGGWVATRRGRQVGPRPILALHRLPNPNCTTCGGHGWVECGVYGQDEPAYEDCHCAPFLPLAYVWLHKRPDWTRRRHLPHDPWCTDPDCTHNQPPF